MGLLAWAAASVAVVMVGRYFDSDVLTGIGAVMVLMTCCID